MAFLDTKVTTLTSTAASRQGFFTAMYNYFVGGTSTKWSLKNNGHNSNAFTIKPADSSKGVFELNLRYRTAEADIAHLIDPIGNITDPGNGTTAPALTDGSAKYGETGGTAHNTQGMFRMWTDPATYSLNFYVIELDDAIMFLFKDSGNSFVPWVTQFGKIWKPYFDEPDFDGLGYWGNQPALQTGYGNNGQYIFNAWGYANKVLLVNREGEYLWGSLPDRSGQPIGGTNAWSGGYAKIAPIYSPQVNSGNPSIAWYNPCYSKYFYHTAVQNFPGTVLRATNDAFIYINYQNSNTNMLLPWDKNVQPDF